MSAKKKASALPPSHHRLILGDARDLSFLEDESIHLVVTSPPYWTLKKYEENPGQLGQLQNTKDFCPNSKRCGDTYSASWYLADGSSAW